MTFREDVEIREAGFIAPYGCPSARSRGRLHPEKPCSIRTAFQLDKFRIVYSNAFRRLKYKTQVFLSPLGDQYRTRLTHTLEVAQIATTIARALHLNEDLAEAIALGHDLGHTPFGHGGETTLNEIYSKGFSHHAQSLRVVDLLENKGKGLNLTHEVRDGILKHSKGYGKIIPDNPENLPQTAEGKIVRIADIMAYLNHDLDDAVRSQVVQPGQIPKSCVETLGENHLDRATTMIKDLITTSRAQNGELYLDMSPNVFSAMTALRRFLYEKVYRSEPVHKEFLKIKKIISELFICLMDDDRLFQKELVHMEMTEIEQNCHSREQIVCDFIASMTDRYALTLYQRIFFPTPIV